jgi:hypothetical protein
LVGEAGPKAVIPLDHMPDFTTPDSGELLEEVAALRADLAQLPFVLVRENRDYALTRA